MKHFIQYHNSEEMGFSVSQMKDPYIHTNKSVRHLSSNIVWIISGEGRSPKNFFLSAVVQVKRVSADTYDHPDYRNSAYGEGHVIGEEILLNDEDWFKSLKSSFNNFKNGLSEVQDTIAIESIRTRAGKYAL